jgi:hypothetical protein
LGEVRCRLPVELNAAIYRTKPAVLDTLPALTHLSAGDCWVLYRVNG